jgi:predicted kinase
MRKWMQDKLKRRKKSAEDQPAGSQPAPLQPAYFEPEPQQIQKSKAPVEPPPEPAPPPQAAASKASDETQAPVANSRAGSQAENMRRPRRRRGRGGRGRRTPGQQPSTAAAAVVADSSAPAAAPRAETPRAAKGVVVLAIGLPGSGKSSWFKRNSITPLSSDMVRALLFDNPAEQRFQDLVFSTLRSMLKARLIAHRPMNYVDATNLTPQERHNWIKLAKDFGYEVHGVFFDVPLEVCIERHQRRDRIVPEDVMRKMSAKLKPPSFDEGFSKITVVKVKQKQEPE